MVQRFGVWGGEPISQMIAAGLATCGISFVQVQPEQKNSDGALFIVPPGADPSVVPSPLHVRYLLLPGGFVQPYIQADCAVSYGMKAQNSITVSSLQEESMVLSLQRELVTLPGYVLERQELCLLRPEGLSTEEALAVYGSLLMLGVMPGDLNRCRLA
ncbi:MAG: hypothetical protein ACOX0U_00680 [Oscillospiraceae bacterium]|jgi:hypothetical protein